MKTKVVVLPIWKITVTDKIYYFVIGNSKKAIMEYLKNNPEEFILDGQFAKVDQVLPENSQNILLQTDLEDEDSYTTLFEEAVYFTEHHMDDFFLATSFDVIADLNLNVTTS